MSIVRSKHMPTRGLMAASLVIKSQHANVVKYTATAPICVKKLETSCAGQDHEC